MFKRSAACLTLALLTLVAGCGGGGKGSAPILPAAPAPTASAGTAGKSKATFTVVVPKAATTTLGAKRPAYVSPATQSMTVSITAGSTAVLSQTVGLTASSTGCSSSLASITCTLTVSLNAGSYTASISTYDGANGTGNVLSTAQNVSFTVAANQNNLVPLSLSGIPNKIVALAAPNNSVYVVAQDADGNFIVGSGAPTFTAAKASGVAVATITQPTSSAPNTISFAQPSPAVVGAETISVTASYPAGQTNGCAQAGAVCTLATPITVSYQQIAFIDNYDSSTLIGFTLPLSSSSQAPAYSLSVGTYPDDGIGVNPSNGYVFAQGYESPYAFVSVAPPYTTAVTNTQTGNNFYYPYGSIAAAPNGDAFAPDYYSNSVMMFTAPYTGTATQITSGVYEPVGAAADSNSILYVANGRTSGGITAYASPYIGTPISVNTSSTPESVTVSGSTLIVGESSGVDVYSLPLSGGASPVATFSNADVYAATMDGSGNIWVACYESCTGSSQGEIFEYKKPLSTGESPSVSLPIPAGSTYTSYNPIGIAFDTAGNLYVQNYEGGTGGDGGLIEFTGSITSSSQPAIGIESSTFDYPYGMVLTPALFSVTP